MLSVYNTYDLIEIQLTKIFCVMLLWRCLIVITFLIFTIQLKNYPYTRNIFFYILLYPIFKKIVWSDTLTENWKPLFSYYKRKLICIKSMTILDISWYFGRFYPPQLFVEKNINQFVFYNAQKIIVSLKILENNEFV